jgi:hypothetical protein
LPETRWRSGVFSASQGPERNRLITDYIQIALSVMKKSRPNIRAALLFLIAIHANPHLSGLTLQGTKDHGTE